MMKRAMKREPYDQVKRMRRWALPLLLALVLCLLPCAWGGQALVAAEGEPQATAEGSAGSESSAKPEASDANTQGQNVQAGQVVLLDEDYFLTADQRQDILTRMQNLAKTYGIHVMVWINQQPVDDMRDSSDVKYEDYCGKDTDGFLFQLNMAKHQYWLSTSGHVIDILNDQRIASIKEAIGPLFKAGDFHGGLVQMLTDIDNYCHIGVAADYQGRVPEEAHQRGLSWFDGGVAGLLALLGGGGFYGGVKRKYTRRSKMPPYIPLQNALLGQIQHEDTFMRTEENTVYSPRPRASSSGGGSSSSTHISSGGGTHGGGGGGF